MVKRITLLSSIICIFIILAVSCATEADEEEDIYTKSEVDDMINDLEADATKIAAWGTINSDGTVLDGSGNYTCERSSAGTYSITWTGGLTAVFDENIFILSPAVVTDYNVTYMTFGGGMSMRAYTYNSAGVLTDCDFNFAVIQR